MSTAQSVLQKFKQYGGHLVDLAEIALIHAGGQLVLKSGFNITGLSAADLQQVTQDKLDLEGTIEKAEAIRQSNEATRIQNEKQRVTEFSVVMNNLGGIYSSEESRVNAEQARVIAEMARDDAEKARRAASGTTAPAVAAADVMVPNDGNGPILPQPVPNPTTAPGDGTLPLVDDDGDGN